jgi:hypothetical protein
VKPFQLKKIKVELPGEKQERLPATDADKQEF